MVCNGNMEGWGGPERVVVRDVEGVDRGSGGASAGVLRDVEGGEIWGECEAGGAGDTVGDDAAVAGFRVEAVDVLCWELGFGPEGLLVAVGWVCEIKGSVSKIGDDFSRRVEWLSVEVVE